MARLKPSDVILDLLRGARPEGRRAAYLIDNGRLFDFTENTVRVTLSRLVSRGLVTSPARGRYRLADSAGPVNQHVERWRLGEARTRDWQPGTWILAHLETTDDRSLWVLDTLGFRQVRKGLYARPDNLASDLDLKRSATTLGLSETSLLADAQIDNTTSANWFTA